jgi:hypothetical protein
MSEQQQQKTVAEILPADPSLKPQVRDIFVDVDPALASRDTELRSLLSPEQ